jgi:hypothetical protein
MTTKTDTRPRARALRSPFGNPEGANANLQELLDNFVEFEDRAPDDALAAEHDEHSTRIVVGKRGVGKTVYMRRFQAAASENPALYADDVQHDGLPTTEHVIEASQQFKTDAVDEMWEAAWRRAIVRSVVSHVVHHKMLRDREESFELTEQLSDYAGLIPEVGSPRSAYTELSQMLGAHRTRDALRRYVSDGRWPDLEYHLGEALKTLPPLCFYLDGTDRPFTYAPTFWLGCQKGLALAVLELIRHHSLRRLHIVTSMHDIVFSSMLRGLNGGKYANEPHIRVLDWDYPAVRQFLETKAMRLPTAYRLSPDADDPLEAWLGKRTVHNTGRGITERVEDYLLRHTRLIPRDVVEVGNLLAGATIEAKQNGLDELPSERIRVLVHDAARRFAEGQLEACARQIAADQIPEHGGPQGYASYFVGNDVYRMQISDLLRKVVAAAGADRVSADQLQKATNVMADQIDHQDQVLDVLWQNGMLGYDAADGCCTHFYSAIDVDDFKLPDDKRTYVFHPCLAHRVNLEPKGDPVLTYRCD